VNLRDYQQRAVDAILTELALHQSTLAVLPTGCGKTVVFSHVAQHFVKLGRVMVLAHRAELIHQAADKIGRVTGTGPDVEMGAMWADLNAMWRGQSDVVVSSIQTQIAGRGGKGRMTRFDPADFSLVIVDEAHHAPAASYRKVLAHYMSNPDLKVLGVTATPDRADEAALGQVFESVSFEYEIGDAITDGWLTPIEQRAVIVEGLDFSAMRTTAGDLNGADLAAAMEYEGNLHGIAHPTYELSAGRKTLVFAASVAHAERLCEIFNRHKPGCSRFVCGTTDEVTRKRTLRMFKAGEFQILVNVGVFTEGFDEPGIQVVAVARPTKSRALYCQMIGRGTRPLDGLVDRHATAEGRRDAIAASDKPAVEVLDFVGNAGRHKLVSCADVLGGKYADEVIDRARENARNADGPVDVRKALDDAQAELFAEEQDRRRQAEAANRARLIARANYTTETVNAFDLLDIRPERERGWHKGRQPSEKQLEVLRKNGVTNAAELSFTHASQLIDAIFRRRDDGRCTLKQARILKRNGYDPNASFAEARQIIDRLAANGWRREAGAA
jgi:superfamily II DNA or RNA helicase